ncbi:DUF1542 domain-containing protein, partial [Streptococcus alactolyticus]|uniref:DUF1542 domain-containing protein n=1 Tax=Streptococcus alactolyticus TaxID=29389 RepID=UPI003CFCC842
MRKYHFGAASVLLGAALVLGGGQVAADEPSASNDIKVVVTQTADEDAPTKAQEGTKESITTPATEVSATESKTEEVTPEGTSSSTATETTDSSVVASADTTEETTPSVEESKTEASSDVTEESTAPSVEESKEAETAPSVEENKTENQESTAESKTETSEDKAEEVAPTTATTTSATETTEKEVTPTIETTPELTTTVAMPASETSQETTPKITDLTPDEIKVLTTSQLAKMDLSNTILASLTFEQSKALTLNKDYQRLGSGGSVSESGDRFFANVQGGTPVNNVNTFRPSVTYESNQAVSDFVNGTDIQLATPTTGEHSSQTISGSLWHDGGVINTYDKAAAESDQNFGWKPIGNYVQVGTNFWGDKDNSNTEATDEEKAAALKLLNAEYNEAAEKLINAAPSSVPETSSENADLKKIVDTSLNDDYLTPERKAAAKQVIEEVYASKQKELQNTPNATQEEIEAALAKLDEEKANTLA